MRHTGRAGRNLTIVGLATVALLAVVAGSCSSDPEPTAEPVDGATGVVEDQGLAQPGGDVVYALEAESDGWNPSNSKWGPAGRQVARTIFDTLTAYDADLIARPNLAESLTPSADYTSWTIVMRPDVVLHNGRPVTAQVVVENLEYLKESVLTASAFEPVESFAATGELELVVTMKRPWVNYPYALTTQIGVVADPDWLRSGDKTNPVGTGPFEFERWIPDNELVVTRNADYWRTDPEGAATPTSTRSPSARSPTATREGRASMQATSTSCRRPRPIRSSATPRRATTVRCRCSPT